MIERGNEQAKIQKYFQVFHDFVVSYHNSNSAEDQAIQQKWQQFRNFADSNPFNLQQHQTYIINKMGEKSAFTKNTASRNPKNSFQFTRMSSQILAKLRKNNQEILGLLSKK